VLSLLLAALVTVAPVREIDLRLPSGAAPGGGLALRVALPPAGRYGPAAPVVVIVPGGPPGESQLSDVMAPLAPQGFIEVRFCFPGEGDSAGQADLRGPHATDALADVLSFAGGGARAVDGRNLADLAAPLRPASDRFGLLAFANGGNSAILALAHHPEQAKGLAWLATWETPLGDGLPTALFGLKGLGLSPAYDPRSGRWEASALAWDRHLVAGAGAVPPGGFYLDLNHNGRFDSGDARLARFEVSNGDGPSRAVYPLMVVREAQRRGLCGPQWPAWVLDTAETEDFWAERNAAPLHPGWDPMAQVAASFSGLAVMVLGGQVDHLQAAPDHPHVFNAYSAWRRLGMRFARLNPAACYQTAAGLAAGPETPPNVDLSRDRLPDRLAPPGTAAGPLAAAAAMELADRCQAGNWSAVLDQVLTATPVNR
jgi:hypothetical protein